MELSPDHLYAVARRWDAWSEGLAETRSALRGAPTTALGDAAGEAVLLLDAVDAALSWLVGDADRLVDGLLVTTRLVADADDRVAAALTRHDPGAGR